jgi:hypothetical protein
MLIDAGIAALLAFLLLILAPGLAIVAITALVVILVCALSFVLPARWGRRRG